MLTNVSYAMYAITRVIVLSCPCQKTVGPTHRTGVDFKMISKIRIVMMIRMVRMTRMIRMIRLIRMISMILMIRMIRMIDVTRQCFAVTYIYIKEVTMSNTSDNRARSSHTGSIGHVEYSYIYRRSNSQ